MAEKSIAPIEGVPVEFKKINIEDFDLNYYQVEKNEIKPNEYGYISEALLPILEDDFDTENTVVINAGVGQGKSKALIKMVSKYTKTKDYVVVIAVPYKNLIKQYIVDCINEGINSKNIFNIQEIDNYTFLEESKPLDFQEIFQTKDTDLINQEKVSDYKVHIMTINALLGNSGESIIFQSAKRLKYFRKLTAYCKNKNKKLIVFFDEIHDSIHNFKEEYIYKLWQFQGLIKKNFIVSATYNEASKEVIKYLSEFTNNNIKIIESDRVILPNKQSKLNFIFNDYKKISKNEHFDKLLKDLIDNDRDFDLIAYSKKQIQQLIKESYLSKIKDDINLCYNDVFDFENDVDNQYDDVKINVGTNFTTGINIEKQNHTYIVILPKRPPNEFVNNRGVFTQGITSIIQTLARQRLVGDIYIVMPTPYNLNVKSIPYSNTIKKKISDFFNEFALTSDVVNYSDINKDNILVSNAYNRLISIAKPATENLSISKRVGMNSLIYPSKERFILEKGESYLTRQFFNGDLSTYTFFAALTNQFINCKINKIFFDESIEFDEEVNIEDIVNEIYRDYCLQKVPPVYIDDIDYIYGIEPDKLSTLSGEEFYYNYYSEFSILKYVLKKIPFNKIKIGKEIASFSKIKDIKRFILLLSISKMNLFIINNLKDENELRKFLTKFYFRSCVKFSEISVFKENDEYYTLTNMESKHLFSNDDYSKIEIYKKWKEYVDLIASEINVKDRILSTNPSLAFITKYKKDDMTNRIEELCEVDFILKDDFIPFRDSFNSSSELSKVDNFFNTLVKVFFKYEGTKQITVNKERKRFYKNISLYDLSKVKYNLLYDKIPDAIL